MEIVDREVLRKEMHAQVDVAVDAFYDGKDVDLALFPIEYRKLLLMTYGAMLRKEQMIARRRYCFVLAQNKTLADEWARENQLNVRWTYLTNRNQLFGHRDGCIVQLFDYDAWDPSTNPDLVQGVEMAVKHHGFKVIGRDDAIPLMP